MATAKSKGDGSLMSEMFAAGLYKRNQGRRVRQWTAVAIGLLFILGANALYNNVIDGLDKPIRIGIAVALGALGCWIAYRTVNVPRFADFLISVQAEMDKVMWAGKKELIRSTIVVLVSMAVIGACLVLFDAVWTFVFRLCGFLKL